MFNYGYTVYIVSIFVIYKGSFLSHLFEVIVMPMQFSFWVVLGDYFLVRLEVDLCWLCLRNKVKFLARGAKLIIMGIVNVK